MMRALVAVAALLVLALTAGCFGHASKAGSGSLAAPFPLPAQCDGARPAVAHGPGGEPRAAALRILPCLGKTGHVSREPTIGITASGAVFDYPAMLMDNTAPTGVAVSRDHGATWDLAMPDVAGVPYHRTSLDPYLYVDPSTSRIFADDLFSPFCSYESWSDDDGKTWTNSVAGCMEADHQTIFAGKGTTDGSIGYPNVVYRCAMNAVALGGTSTLSTCQKSPDGGMTWILTGRPAFQSVDPEFPGQTCDAAHGHGIADANGTIYLPKGHCGVAMVAVSDDEGSTWRHLKASTPDVPATDHEVGVGVDRLGTIYVAWTGPDGLPYLAHSSDKGVGWSKPLEMAPPGMKDTVWTELYVGGPGRLVLAYMGSRQDKGAADQTYEAMMTVTYDALDASPTFYSATINDPAKDAFVVGACCGGVQDFIDVRIGPDGTAWSALVDDCIGPGTSCSNYQEALDTQREGAVGWLVGGPSLWDPADPTGPYP